MVQNANGSEECQAACRGLRQIAAELLLEAPEEGKGMGVQAAKFIRAHTTLQVAYYSWEILDEDSGSNYCLELWDSIFLDGQQRLPSAAHHL